MAFEIVRSRGTLPGRATAVRARLDVDTGGQMIARAIGGLGGALTDLGMKYHLIEADTQADDAIMMIDDEHAKYIRGLQAVEDTSEENYSKLFNESMAKRNGFLPKNRLAQRKVQSYITNNLVRWGKENVAERHDKLRDNQRMVGFNLRQQYVQQGGIENYTKYLTHLHKGRLLGTYTAEEATKYLQGAIDDRQIFERAETARLKKEQKEALEEAQEQAASSFLVGIWDGTLKNPNDITEALRAGLLTDTDAKYLRNAMLNPEPPKTDINAYIEVKEGLNDLARGSKTKKNVLSIISKNVGRLDPTTGKSLVNEVFTRHDRYDADMEREGRDLMEELIREKDPISGMFTSNEREILAAAEALIELDAAIENASVIGKPLRGKELLVEAIKIGRRKKREIKEEEKKGILPGFEFEKVISETREEFALRLGEGEFIPDDTRLYMEPPPLEGKVDNWMALSESQRKDLWFKYEHGEKLPEFITTKTDAEVIFDKYNEVWRTLSDKQKAAINKAWEEAGKENVTGKEFIDWWRKVSK